MVNQTVKVDDLPAYMDAHSVLLQASSLQMALEMSAFDMERGDLVAAMCGIRGLTLMACEALEKMKNLEVHHA